MLHHCGAERWLRKSVPPLYSLSAFGLQMRRQESASARSDGSCGSYCSNWGNRVSVRALKHPELGTYG
jgi:hypothetical protein